MILLMDVLIYSYIFILGLIFGSFFNVVGIRVPRKETLLGRSHCPSCGKQLGAVELIPILGYLIVKGKCKECKSPISIKYPIMELLTGILFLVSFAILRDNMVEYILIVVFISLLIIISVSDMYYRIVPDIILLIFFPIILTLRLISPIQFWYDGIIGGIVGFVFMYLIALYGKKRFKKDALGGGDIKLYLIIGLVLGYQTVFLSLLFGSLLALIYSGLFNKKGNYIAFVPFIAMGSLLAYFFGNSILEWYITILS